MIGEEVWMITRRMVFNAAWPLGLMGCQATGQHSLRSGPTTTISDRAPLRLIYVSADNCPWCQRWHREEGQEFENSPLRRTVSYEQINFSAFQSYRVRAAWPAEHAYIHDQLVQRRASFTSPLFIVMRDRDIVVSGGGTRSWATSILPVLSRDIAA